MTHARLLQGFDRIYPTFPRGQWLPVVEQEAGYEVDLTGSGGSATELC
jgi:hypothetical protein